MSWQLFFDTCPVAYKKPARPDRKNRFIRRCIDDGLHAYAGGRGCGANITTRSPQNGVFTQILFKYVEKSICTVVCGWMIMWGSSELEKPCSFLRNPVVRQDN